jgi:hypothetical protein
VALLLAGAVVLFAAVVGTGVMLGRGGKGGVGGGTGAAAGAVSTVAAGDTGNGSGGAGGVGSQSGSGGGRTGGGGSSSPTTSPATSTTSGATTTTTQPPLRVVGYISEIDPQCTAAPSGGYYDYTVKFEVDVHVTGAGTLRFQWGRGTADIRTPATTYMIPPERQVAPYATYTLRDSISGRAPSAITKVVDRLHILDPPADRVFEGMVDVVMTHSVC